MAIAFVQSAKAGALTSSVQTVTPVLGANSTAGNLLVAAVNFKSSSATITAPASWVQAAIVQAQSETLVIFYYANNPGSLTSFAFTTTATAGAMSAIVAEFSGVATSSPLDVTATNNGSSTALDSGTTATTSTANELWFGAMGYGSAATRSLSAITNSFTADLIADASNAGGTNGAHTSDYYKIVSATGTADVGATLSVSSSWVGAIATFKSASGAKTRTVPVTAALQSTNTRSVPVTAALQATNTRTVPATAALQATNTRTIPSSAALQSTLTRAVPSTAALLQTSQRTIPSSAALLAALSRPIPTSAALQSLGLTRTVPSTTALQATLNRTVPAQAALLATLARVIPVTAALSGSVFYGTGSLSDARLNTALLADVALNRVGTTDTALSAAILADKAG